MSKSSKTIRIISEIGLFAALGFILDEVQGLFFQGIFINGGSIGFAMIAVIVIGYRRGFLPALLTGLIMGVFDIATKATIIHPAQLLLDYILPYALVSVSAFFAPLIKKKGSSLYLILGVVVGGLFKLLSHYLAGVFFWADPEWFAWDLNWMNPNLYCLVYNIAFIGPSIVLTALLTYGLYKKAPQLVTPIEQSKEDAHTTQHTLDFISPVLTLSGGLTLFIYYLTKYIQSYVDKTKPGQIKYKFDQDCMVMVIIGIMLLCIGIYALYTYCKNTYNRNADYGLIIFAGSFSTLYGLVRTVSCAKEGLPYNLYLVWLFVSFAIVCCTVILIILLNKLLSKQEA